MHLLSANIAEFAFYRFLLCPAVGHRILENEFVNFLVFVKSKINYYLDYRRCHTDTRVGCRLEAFVVNQVVANCKYFAEWST